MQTKIVELLRRHSVPVWFGPTDIKARQYWHDEVGEALERCDWFVILLSPQSMKSFWVNRELMFALDEARYDKRIVPLVIRACNPRKLSWTLSLRQFIYFTEDFETGCRALLRIWGIGYQPADPTT